MILKRITYHLQKEYIFKKIVIILCSKKLKHQSLNKVKKLQTLMQLTNKFKKRRKNSRVG
jgi:hypothetical protein